MLKNASNICESPESSLAWPNKWSGHHFVAMKPSFWIRRLTPHHWRGIANQQPLWWVRTRTTMRSYPINSYKDLTFTSKHHKTILILPRTTTHNSIPIPRRTTIHSPILILHRIILNPMLIITRRTIPSPKLTIWEYSRVRLRHPI